MTWKDGHRASYNNSSPWIPPLPDALYREARAQRANGASGERVGVLGAAPRVSDPAGHPPGLLQCVTAVPERLFSMSPHKTFQGDGRTMLPLQAQRSWVEAVSHSSFRWSGGPAGFNPANNAGLKAGEIVDRWEATRSGCFSPSTRELIRRRPDSIAGRRPGPCRAWPTFPSSSPLSLVRERGDRGDRVVAKEARRAFFRRVSVNERLECCFSSPALQGWVWRTLPPSGAFMPRESKRINIRNHPCGGPYRSSVWPLALVYSPPQRDSISLYTPPALAAGEQVCASKN